jgi:rhodanese-related sulfurtransferase
MSGDTMADKITAKDLAEKKRDFVLVDVRESDEVAEDGTIEGAVNIPLGQLIRKARQGGGPKRKDSLHLLQWRIQGQYRC